MNNWAEREEIFEEKKRTSYIECNASSVVTHLPDKQIGTLRADLWSKVSH